MLNIIKKRPAVLLILFFLLSIAIRYPHLNRPLSKHHEFNAGMVLVCIDTWNTNGGPSYSGFCPVLNYTNKGDKFFSSKYANTTSVNGDDLYMSFGPGWFLFPYYFFKVFHLPASPLSLQFFDILLCLLSMALVFKIAKKMFNEESDAMPTKAIIATILFLLNPASLWYFGNGFVHEVMTIPFFLAAAYVFLSFIENGSNITFKRLLLYGILLITGIFCDWLCVFWSGITILYAFFRSRKDKQWGNYIIVTILSTIMAIAIVFLVYGHHVGYKNYFTLLHSRYDYRGMNEENSGSLFSYYWIILKNYLTSYLPLFIALLILLIINRRMIRPAIIKQHPGAFSFIVLLVATCLLHHFIFPQFSGHEYAVFKSALFLSLCTAALSTNYKTSYIIIGLFIILSIAQFYYINPVGAYSFDGERYDYAKTIGNSIKENASADEVVYINYKNGLAEPQIMYYAKRTCFGSPNLQDAKVRLADQTYAQKAVWFDIVNDSVTSIIHFSK
ncbi:glycosyltransferase family protein [Ferruginibacter albus]|uniref:hypothetical protein n=1 Tax=Ferruginibacter albus TaxID=2875540 RepID=UPI001CC71059|nr:hypothetical protein [Ferruginibacter albus]UAY52903.1 hypothetical protein K9M53_04295 [Ferruginibacter albus]